MSLSRVPAISFQGTSGCAARNSVDTLLTASPMIKSWCRTADWVFASSKNSAFPVGPLNSIARRAALRISRRCASSRSKVWLRALQDGLAPYPIRAPLDRSLRHEVHLAPDDTGEFLFHRNVIHQAPVCICREPHQQVQIAVRPEVFAQRRSEHAQFGDLPPAAEFIEPRSRNGNF